MIGISVIFFDWLVKQWCYIKIFPLEISGSKTLRIWHNICGCNIHWQKKETKHPITTTLKASWRQTDTDPAVWLTNKSKKCLVRIWGRAHLNLLLDSAMCAWQGACENRPIKSPALHHCRFSEYGCSTAEFGKKTLIVACKTCVGVSLLFPCVMNKGSPQLLMFIGFCHGAMIMNACLPLCRRGLLTYVYSGVFVWMNALVARSGSYIVRLSVCDLHGLTSPFLRQNWASIGLCLNLPNLPLIVQIPWKAYEKHGTSLYCETGVPSSGHLSDLDLRTQ